MSEDNFSHLNKLASLETGLYDGNAKRGRGLQ